MALEGRRRQQRTAEIHGFMASLIKDVFHEITRINHVFISALCANDAVHAAASCVVTLTQFRRMMSSSIIGEYTNFNAYEGTLELCSNGIHLKPVVYRLLCSSLPIRLYVLWASTANWWVSSNCGPGNREQFTHVCSQQLSSTAKWIMKHRKHLSDL